MRRVIQFFSDDYIDRVKDLTPTQIADFVSQYQSLIHSGAGKKKLISLRVPKELLDIFKAKSKISGHHYQTQIVELMRWWALGDQNVTAQGLSVLQSVKKIVSGGQTGVDRAALDVALNFGIQCGGWCPQNRIAEDGTIPDKYHLLETPTKDPKIRTEWNVRDSDGTFLIVWNPLPSDETRWTLHILKKRNKPRYILNLSENADPKIPPIQEWLRKNSVKILNIAGPRGSYRSDVYLESYRVIAKLLSSECLLKTD